MAALEALPPQVQHDAFFRFWTLKEAYIKARGLGLSIPLQSFAFSLGDGRPPTMALTKPDDGTPTAWQFAELRPSDRHRAAVAIQCPQDCAAEHPRRRGARGREHDVQGRGEADGSCSCVNLRLTACCWVNRPSGLRPRQDLRANPGRGRGSIFFLLRKGPRSRGVGRRPGRDTGRPCLFSL